MSIYSSNVKKRFAKNVIDNLVIEIQRNKWDESLSSLYQWPLTKQLERLIEKLGKSDAPGWLKDLANQRDSSDTNREPTFEMTLKLRQEMPAMLKGETTERLKLWIVKDWGGIRSDDKSLLKCFHDAEEEHGKVWLPGKNPTNNKGGKREFTFERIASWSKYLAFKYPDQYAIYDARVIYSLNWLLFKAGTKEYFPFLDGQNSVMGILNYKAQLFLEYYGKKKLLEDLKNDISAREGTPGKKSRLRTELEKGLFIRKKEAYSEYCDLLKELAERIFPGDKFGLTKVEMVLFSIADKDIANEVMDLLTGNEQVLANDQP